MPVAASWMARNGAVRDFVTEARRSDGSALWVSQNTRAIRDNDGRIVHYEGMVVDITARKCAEERLIRQALHDPLTGLPNRSLFLHRLQQAIAGGRQGAAAGFALLFIDCDRFKLVNDSLGHLAGDRLLVLLGHRIAGCLRGGDTLARLAETSSRFSSRMPCLEARGLSPIGCSKLASVPSTSMTGKCVSVSIGITLDSADYESPSEMLRDADTLQCEWLVAAGCTYAQGYFLSPPVEPRAATALLLREQEEFERAAVND